MRRLERHCLCDRLPRLNWRFELDAALRTDEDSKSFEEAYASLLLWTLARHLCDNCCFSSTLPEYGC